MKKTITVLKRNFKDIKAEGSYSSISSKKQKPQIINISGKPTKINFSMEGISKLVFLPDYSPGNEGLQVGTVAIFNRAEHEPSGEYIGPDIGCGLLLAKFSEPISKLESKVDAVAADILDRRSGLGSLGSGNHFITIYDLEKSKNPDAEDLGHYVLIHTGSREIGIKVFDENLKGDDYVKEHDMAVKYAKSNRAKILDIVRSKFNMKVNEVIDKVHNYMEITPSSVIYRKGAMKLSAGEQGIVPSHMAGDALIVRGKEQISELSDSINHGTGRKMSRSSAREKMFFLGGKPDSIYTPYFIDAHSLTTELPDCYRDIDDVKPYMTDYVDFVNALTPIASIMG